MTLYNAALTRTLLYRELLRGPLYYVLVLLFSVLVFWRESPIGVVSLSMMSGGDRILRKLASLSSFAELHCTWLILLSIYICLDLNLAGFADIVGRRYGSVKLPFNQKKSWIGSISMFISGFLLSAM